MDSQEVIEVGELRVRYLHDGSASGQMGAFELVVPPGSNVPPPHSHVSNEELIVVLEGRLRYSVNAVARDLGPGDSMSTPKGSVHGFSNPFFSPARALVVLSPDIGAGFFRDVAAVVNVDGPPDRSRLLEVMAHHGLKMPPPPRSDA
jgi:quercetin dioxygenase-like cupin family protein